jgi:DNA-binding transcriptional ArsR family regulator
VKINGIFPQHVRFGVSPARETLRAVEVLAGPVDHAEQIPWVRIARKRLPRSLARELRHFRFLFHPHAETFPLLWEADGYATFASELASLRRASRSYKDAVLIRLSGTRTIDRDRLRDIRRPSWYRTAVAQRTTKRGQDSEMLREFAVSPPASHARFCDFVARFHAAVVEPGWFAIEKRLLADIEPRAAVLAERGVVPALGDISPDVAVVREDSGATALSVGRGEHVVRFTERSRLTLAPSAFTRPEVQLVVLNRDGELDCRLVYPISTLPARAAKIARRTNVARLMSAAGDPTRLRMLELLSERDLSTRELAGFLKLAEPGVSRHLARLFDAGLVTKRRIGYYVVYALVEGTLRDVAAALLSLT